jgi:ribosome maturation protein Sdo1
MQKQVKNIKTFRRVTRNQLSKAAFENSFRMHPNDEINEALEKIVKEINEAAYIKFKEALAKRNIFLQ